MVYVIATLFSLWRWVLMPWPYDFQKSAATVRSYYIACSCYYPPIVSYWFDFKVIIHITTTTLLYIRIIHHWHNIDIFFSIFIMLLIGTNTWTTTSGTLAYHRLLCSINLTLTLAFLHLPYHTTIIITIDYSRFLAIKLFAVSIGSAAVAVAITLSVIVYQHSAPIVFEIHQHHTASSYFHYLHQYHSIDIASLTISLYIIKTLLNYDDWYIMSSHLLLFYQSNVHSHFHCSYALPVILKIS